MNSYLDIMVQLMIMMGIVSVIMLPSMYEMSRFSALSSFPGFTTNQFTLGNIGGADALC